METLWRTLEGAAALIPHADVRVVAAAFLLDVIILVMAGLRWRAILRALRVHIDTRLAVLMNAAGNALSNVTPARAIGGDAFRVAVVRLRSDATVRTATASVVYDRLADVVGMLCLVLVASPRLPRSSGLWVGGGLVGVSVVLFVAAPLRRQIVTGWQRWQHTLVGAPFDRAVMAVALPLSAGAWLLDVCRVMLAAAAFGAHLSPPQAAAVSLARLAGGAVPVPGGIGVVDAALLGTLIWCGLSPEVAGAVALLERAIVYGWATLLGIGALTCLGGRELVIRLRAGGLVNTPDSSLQS